MGPAVWRRDPRPSAAGEATAYRGRERERKNSRDGGREKEFWSLDARRAINKRRANKSKMIDSRPAAKKKNLFALHLLPPPPSLSLSLSLSRSVSSPLQQDVFVSALQTMCVTIIHGLIEVRTEDRGPGGGRVTVCSPSSTAIATMRDRGELTGIVVGMAALRRGEADRVNRERTRMAAARARALAAAPAQPVAPAPAEEAAAAAAATAATSDEEET